VTRQRLSTLSSSRLDTTAVTTPAPVHASPCCSPIDHRVFPRTPSAPRSETMTASSNAAASYDTPIPTTAHDPGIEAFHYKYSSFDDVLDDLSRFALARYLSLFVALITRPCLAVSL
jgi:hypothetical protein